MKTPRFRLLLSLAVLPLATRAQIVWDFGTSSGTTSFSSNSYANLTVSSVGSANFGTALNNNTSASSGYTGASGNFNYGGTAVTAAFNASTSSYITFTITPSSGYQIQVTSISLGSRSTGTGPTGLSIRSSNDAYASDLATNSLSANSTWALINPTLTSVTSSSALTFRVYGYGGAGTAGSGNWRIDDLTVSLSVSAIPEPAECAALAGAAALVFAAWRRRRASQGATSRSASETPAPRD